MKTPATRSDSPAAPPRRRLSIATYLGIGLGSLVATALGILLWVTLSTVFKNTTELLNDKSRIFLGSLTAQTTQFLNTTLAPTEVVAREIAEGRIDPRDDERMMPLMRTLLASTPQVTAMAFFDTDGTRVASYREDGRVLADRQPWPGRQAIEDALEGVKTTRKPAWGPPINEPYIGTFVNFARPVFKGDSFAGMSTAVINIQALSAFLDDIETEVGQNAFILYDRDYVLAHRNLIQPFEGLSKDNPLPTVAGLGDPILAGIWNEGWEDYQLTAGSGHFHERVGQDYIFLYTPLDDFADAPWLIGSYFPEDTIATQFQRMMETGVIALVIVLLAIAATWLFGRVLRRPIQTFAEAAGAVRDLDLDRVQKLPPSRFAELDEAGRAFNGMVGALKSFSLYVPKTLVQRLMARGDVTDIRSEVRQVTVLMTDVVGFTTLAEQMSAEETAAFLNDHLALVTACIEAEGGVVDKFMGDAVMALWGALEDEPDQAARAVAAARRIVQAVEAGNQLGGQPVRVRIGIHCGMVVAGNIGTTTRMNYTVVGDAVNMAQRLEVLGKTLLPNAETAILLSADTRRGLDASTSVRSLGLHTVRGREGQVEVFTLGDKD
ncbi:MAG: adenylate/guanylate cyclase domain-containing protein [Pseudomonadota bacterium]